MAEEPKLPTPMIEPNRVATAILGAATAPKRAVKVGAMSTVNTTVAKILPGLGDRMALKQRDRQQYEEPARNPEGALNTASEQTGVVARTRGTGGREAASA